MLFNGGAASGNGSDVTVNGGTLGGTGTIRGAVAVTAGAIAPGASAGTLTVANTLGLSSDATLNFELDGADQTVGSGVNDLIDSVTDLTLDGTLNVSALASFASASQGDTWRLINYSGSLTDNGLVLGTMPTAPAGLSFIIDTATAGEVNLTLVPEPASMSLLALGAVALLRRRRQAP